MKKFIKHIIIALVSISLFVGMFALNVSAAASITVSGGEYNVGQSVSIAVKISNDDPIMTAQITVNYNSSVLTLKSVSGAEYTTGNGTINIVDDNFSTATKDVKTGSYTLNFTAVAAGNSNISVSTSIADKNLAKSTASASAAVTVVTPKPSSNANLASIKLSSGSLSPAFNANTTSYSATVKYSVDTITITGAVADGGATYVGGGTFGLEVGNNERSLTVTAADGTKKTYTVNIKRMTEQETADAEQAARDADPLLVIIDGADYKIVNDLTGITVPAGFTQGTATRKESEIAVLNDEAGKYQLCWLVDANGENGAFYSRDSEDNFTKLVHINANGKMYIVEPLGDYGTMPIGFILSKCSIDGTEIDAITYEDENLREFYVLNCYVGGTTGYYRFDTVEGTMQRAVDFDAALEMTATNANIDDKNNGRLSWFTNMNKTGKIVFLIIVFAAVILIAVAVILIVKIASSGKDDYKDEYVPEANNDFVLNDFADEALDEEQPKALEQPEQIVQEADIEAEEQKD